MSSIWAKPLKHASSFPDRLDDEHSFISLLLPFKADGVIKCDDARRIEGDVSLRVTFRIDHYWHQSGLDDARSTDARIEIFNAPADAGSCLISSLEFFPRLKAAIDDILGLQDIISAQKRVVLIEPDPGDLPEHFTLDIVIGRNLVLWLHECSNHRLAQLAGHDAVEYLRTVKPSA